MVKVMSRIGRLAIVVPCYNEEEMLPISIPKLVNILQELISEKKIKDDSYLLFVNDGSKDKTWEVLQDYSDKNNMVKALKLSRNRGHQNALIAGLFTANKDCDFTISIDADLQDDITKMKEMVDFYNDGCEIVYGVRSSRKTDSFFKRVTAQGFYKFLKKNGS